MTLVTVDSFTALALFLTGLASPAHCRLFWSYLTLQLPAPGSSSHW